MQITEPAMVIASHLHHPIIWPNGPTYFQIETDRRYSANDRPLIRDAAGAPLTLTEELAPGSVVRLAIGDDGLLRAVQIMQAMYADPFAEAA